MERSNEDNYLWFYDSLVENAPPGQNGSMPDELGDTNPYADGSLLCGVFMIVVGIVGLIVNITTVRIFTHRPLVSSINTLLAGLAVADAALLVSGVPLYGSVAVFSYLSDSPLTDELERAISYMTVYLYPFTSIFQTSSVWTMVLITIERYVAVCHPFIARTVCTWRRAIFALAAVSVSSVLYNICRFWEYEIKHTNDTEIELTQGIRADRNYMNIYGHWLYFTFLFALPFAVLLLLNTAVVITIKRANRFRANLSRRQCKEHATATMMVVVATFFLACNCLGCILNAMDVFGLSTQQLTFAAPELDSQPSSNKISASSESEESTEDMPVHTPLFYFLIDLNNLLVMVHCSCNFFIYLIFSRRFRNYFCLLSPCCHFRQRRLRDMKTPSVLDQDPLSTLSLKGRCKRSTAASTHTEDGELELTPTAPITPINKTAWIPLKRRREWSFGAAESAEALICRQYHVPRDHLTLE